MLQTVEDRLEEKNRKGISTFIATLLLMVLAVAAGVVIYAYTMGYLGGFGSPTQMGAISIDSATATITSVDVYVRNIGKTTVKVSTLYYTDSTAILRAITITSEELKEGEVKLISFAITLVDSGKTYTFKLVCEDNTQISFPLKIS